MADDKNPAKCNRNILHIASFGREGQPGQAMPANDHNWPFWATIVDLQVRADRPGEQENAFNEPYRRHPDGSD
ncbi:MULTISPECIES: hypothetical protein [unclassified Thalassospira]|jgi:hypothetical protein|uniref:hypothetical protein n=1 Tax=unclassified Thalassospira TaxID=2648997 RepID=UPI002579BFB6|nr:hypothetical protein [Thalassospira sp.]